MGITGWVGLGLTAVLALGGCGGDDDPGSAAPAGPTASQLAASLVDAGDLGAGWAVLQPPAEYGGVGVVTDKNRELVPRLDLCDDAPAGSRSAASDLAWEAFTQVNFETGDERHLIFVQEFLRSDEADAVRTSYDLIAAGMRACRGARSVTDDGETIVESAFDVPALGAARIGNRQLVTEPGPASGAATWDLRQVLVRDGTRLVGVTVAEIRAPGRAATLDEDGIAELITTVVDKTG